LLGSFAVDLHRLREVRIEGGDENALGGLDQMYAVADIVVGLVRNVDPTASREQVAALCRRFPLPA